MNGHSRRSIRKGFVREYDVDAGYGTVIDGDTTDAGEWYFHCTAIADGSRTIAADAAVTFSLTPGHHGRLEATDIRTV